MTKEECIKKLEAIEKSYEGRRRQFTVDFFDGRVNDICNCQYICNEEEDLGALVYRCDTILGIMREDIVDRDAISKVKYVVSSRLKTIGDER